MTGNVTDTVSAGAGWFDLECFPAGTLICTRENGVVTYTPIELIHIADEVLTHNGRWREVLRTRVRHASTVHTIDEDGHHLTASANHPVYCWNGRPDSKPDWKPLSQAVPGLTRWAHVADGLIDAGTGFDPGELEWLTITDLKRDRQVVPVYNFQVHEDESYVAESIVVHNCRLTR